MAQKALGSCDWVGTHVVWLAKSLGIMRFGWNSYMVWLKKTRRTKEEENETLRAMFIRDRERNNTYVRKPFRIILCFFLRCVTSEFIRTFGFRRVVSEFWRYVSLVVSEFWIYVSLRIFGEGCFGVLEICVTSEFRIFVFQRVVSEFWRYVSLRNFAYSYFRVLFRSFEDKA